jgi:trigger factor
MSSQQYGMDPNQFAQSLDQEGQIPAMVAEVARRKALASVLEKVAVKDTAGNVIDLNEAVPGTEGDEGVEDIEVVTEESIGVVEVDADVADDTEAAAKA